MIDVYFNKDSIANGDVFEGGFFTNLSAANLFTALQNASINYWVQNSSGSTVFNTVNYSPLTSLAGITGVKLQTAYVTKDFGGTIGNVTGSVTQLVIVPEPGAIALAGIGVGIAGWMAWKRRRNSNT